MQRIDKRTRRLTAVVAGGIVAALLAGLWSASAPADRGPEAVTAKKKGCKKHPRAKRCRRLRILLSWDDNANIDLYVWDAALRQASPLAPRAIPRAIHSGDTGVNPEKFFDARGSPKRPLAFGVCLGQVPSFEPSNYTITYVRPDGSRFVDHDSLFDAGQSVIYTSLPDVPDPDPGNTGAWCHAH